MTKRATQNDPRSTIHDLRLVILGHVDHGKSTLVGRLLHETGALPDGKFEQIKASCDKRGMAFEWAFLMDALQAERDQNVTIDTTQIWFSGEKRRYCLIDAPGHREFLKNMITGAASADAALLLVDAQEGLKAQSRRHAYLLHLLGIRHVIVAINKMDLVGYDVSRFEALVAEYEGYLSGLGIAPLAYVPLSARDGEGLAEPSKALSWYHGPPLLQAIEQLPGRTPAVDQPLRFAIQDVYRFDARRIIAGRIESGQLEVGDELLFSPSNERAKVRSIERWPEDAAAPTMVAQAGESVGVTLEEQIFVERGQLASHLSDPPKLCNLLQVKLFWMQDAPLQKDIWYRLRMNTADYAVKLVRIDNVLDPDSLQSDTQATQVEKLQVAEVTLRVRGLASVDDHQELERTGRFVLFDGYRVAGGGVIHASATPDMRALGQKTIKSAHIRAEDFEIDGAQRAAQNGHRPGVLWFTGLSGSGKSTLARELQKRLFSKGCQVYVLDGDNMRHGLCSDLGFSPEDRSENIRRVGEVAKLFADAGFIVITAFISPYKEDRRRAEAMAPGLFHTVHIHADLDVCESRDVKGLYQKARAGEITEFTGISAPYEAPIHPDLVVNTGVMSIEESIQMLVAYVETQFINNAS